MQYGQENNEKLLSQQQYTPIQDRTQRKQKSSRKKLWLTALAGLAVYLVATNFDWSEIKLPGCGKHKHAPQGDKEKWTTEEWFPSPRGGTVEPWAHSYARAADLVSKMTLLEKVNITTGVGWQQGLCLGNSAPASHVGFPSLCYQDGPLGLRHADHATAFPAALTAGATFNPSLAFSRGAAHGEEARRKGIHVILGPSMGPIGRMPEGGRNWEGFGADPYLQGVMAAETIRGIQEQGVIATAKHWVVNEQEHFRQAREWGESWEDSVSENVDGRTLREGYAWPFMDAVRAGVGSVMCSYNQINNSYGCGNSYTMNKILKDELGFQGFVQSDWWAAHSGAWAALSGLDVMMPGTIQQTENNGGASYFGANLTAAVMNGTVPLERLDDMALRVVAAWYQMGQDNPEKFPQDGPNFSSWTDEEEDYLHHGAQSGPRGVVNKYVNVQSDHWQIARQVAIEGTVLAKNVNRQLPLRKGSWAGKKIGIFGEDAGDDEQEGFPNFCPDRGCNKGSLASGWGSGAVEFPHFHTPQTSLRRAFNTSKTDIPDFVAITDNSKLDEMKKAAAESDLCFAFINSDAGEGYITDPVTGTPGDRNDLYPQLDGTKVVQSVAGNCANTIVVIHAVGPVIVEEFVEHPNVTALLFAHLPGQESGEALTSILFGENNPSGKLPYTVGKSLEDYGPGARILRHSNANPPQQTFEEGMLFDYRWFDKKGVEPRYEFGYGLSYTSFNITNIHGRVLVDPTPFPTRRPDGVAPPEIDSSLPDDNEVLFPEGFEKLRNYVYPYLESPPKKEGKVSRPKDYDTPRPLSPSGGAEGGNPDLWTEVAEITFEIQNTGNTPGAEVVQVYVSMPEVEGEVMPVRVLRGFEKVWLGVGEKEEVRVRLRRRDLSYWDEGEDNWKMMVEGAKVQVGRSSRDIVGEVEL